MEPDPARILQELYDADDSKYFDDVAEGPLMGPPVVGVADADDRWFARFKEVIGDFHWTAQEAFAAAFPGSRARSVISWSTPISGAAKLANRTESRFPSRQWALVRHHSTGLLERLAAGMVDTLQDMGFATVAPEQSPRFEVAMRENVGLAGQWSQRHVAFVAGLGTFGISGGLITAHGIAHRLCSVVTEAEIPPTPRPYGDDPFAWCLRELRGKCGACIARCPAGSIGEDSQTRDKDACRSHGRAVREHMSEVLGFSGSFGCGLCQTGVPCESRIPVAER